MFRLVLLMASMAFVSFAQGPLRFELKRVEKQTKACAISFEYPEIVSAASSEVRDRINAGVLRVLLRQSDWPGNNSGFRSLDAYADAFLKYCDEYQKRPEAHDLYEHKFVTIFRYTPPVLSFRCDADADLGGVHPFGTTFFVNFEGSTGKELAIGDLLKQGALPKLETIAERIFRRSYNLPASGSLSEQGYDFPGDRFRLNDNFGVGERDLFFLFNTYEIGAGAMPPTEISIPLGLLRELLKFNVERAGE